MGISVFRVPEALVNNTDDILHQEEAPLHPTPVLCMGYLEPSHLPSEQLQLGEQHDRHLAV